MSAPKKAKMADLINYRLRVVTIDGRQLAGQMLAFDKHMNFVLADTQEFRVTNKTKKLANPTEEVRALGLVILRGETVVSVSVESAPSAQDHASARLGGAMQQGTGSARPINRGALGANSAAGLSAPVRQQAPAGFGSSGAGSGFQPPPGFR